MGFRQSEKGKTGRGFAGEKKKVGNHWRTMEGAKTSILSTREVILPTGREKNQADSLRRVAGAGEPVGVRGGVKYIEKKIIALSGCRENALASLGAWGGGGVLHEKGQR